MILWVPYALSIIAGVAASSGGKKTYDCHVDAPLAVHRNGMSAILKTIKFPQMQSENWSFQITIEKTQSDHPDYAVVTWPSNPIQLAGRYPVLPTASGAIAFAAVSSGPCVFTDTACIATVQIADQEPGNAKISILPAALTTTDESNKLSPFVVVIDGTCTWKVA